MPAHSLAAARGVRTQISIENSHRREHPRSMNYGKRVSTRCRCPTSVPAARCSSHSGWARPGPSKAIRKPSPAAFASRPRNRANSFAQGRGVAAAVHPIFRCCLLRRIDDIGEKNCCQSSIRLGTGRIPVRNSSIPSSSASTVPSDKVAEIVRASL